MEPVKDPRIKLEAIRRGMQYSFPAPDIEQMHREIEAGYQEMPDRLGLGLPDLAPNPPDVVESDEDDSRGS